MEFAIIVATDRQRGIGKNNAIPWDLKGDMAHFRDVTVGDGQNAVIMGRKTWESLPEKFRPLPKRKNLVLSWDLLELPSDVLQADSFESAFEKLADVTGQVFVIGGGSIYAQAIQRPECATLFITEIDADFDCDTWFPAIPTDFNKIESSEPQIEGGIAFRFVTYRRS